MDVTLLEQEHTGYGASGRNPGFVWLHCRNPGWALEISLAGRRLYDELLRDLPEPFEFRAEGGLIYFKTPEQGVVFEEFVKARAGRRARHGADRRRRGAPAGRTDPPRRARRQLLRQRRPDQHAHGGRRAGRRRPGRRRGRARARARSSASSRATTAGSSGSRRTRDASTADMVVVATGAWTSKLLAESGLDVPSASSGSRCWPPCPAPSTSTRCLRAAGGQAVLAVPRPAVVGPGRVHGAVRDRDRATGCCSSCRSGPTARRCSAVRWTTRPK